MSLQNYINIDLKNYIKFNIKYKNKHKLIPLGYALAITFAFIISLTNNNYVNASVSKTGRLDYLSLEENVLQNLSDNDAIYPQSSVDNIKSLFNAVNSYKKEIKVTKDLTIKKGDTFISILNDLGLNYQESHNIYLDLKKVYDPRNLKVGQKLKINAIINNQSKEVVELLSVIITPDVGRRYIISQTQAKTYQIQAEKDELIEEINSAQGTISGTLSASMQKYGVPSKVVHKFTSIFASSIDFRRDVRKGDKFELVYENQITPEGKLVKSGDLLYAALILKTGKLSLYRYEDAKGNAEYYDEKGEAKKKALYRKPLAFQAARISSPFGKRRHPILRDLRIHWGIDYAAPRGTAIFAAGDGVVQVAKYNGAYGNYIKIRHNGEFSTAYGHMKGFAKGIRSGTRVKQGQVIGYVGTTGRSTGPHLHYEVVQKGKRVNPRGVTAATGDGLSGRDLKKLKTIVAEIKNTYGKTFAKNANDKNKLASK